MDKYTDIKYLSDPVNIEIKSFEITWDMWIQKHMDTIFQEYREAVQREKLLVLNICIGQKDSSKINNLVFYLKNNRRAKERKGWEKEGNSKYQSRDHQSTN